MKRYIVIYVSFIDNELLTDIVEAEDEFQALEKAGYGYYLEDDFDTIEDIYLYAFNTDSLLKVVEI